MEKVFLALKVRSIGVFQMVNFCAQFYILWENCNGRGLGRSSDLLHKAHLEKKVSQACLDSDGWTTSCSLFVRWHLGPCRQL
jgi:hypothetical protein